MGDFAGLSPWRSSSGPVPAYPTPSNARGDTPARAVVSTGSTDGGRSTDRPSTDGDDDLREELRRIIIEELHDLIGGAARG
jgi:hypothetical protein